MEAKEITGKGIEIVWNFVPKLTRVYIDGQDVSRYIRGFSINCYADGDPIDITLRCMTAPDAPEQTIRGRLFIDDSQH